MQQPVLWGQTDQIVGETPAGDQWRSSVTALQDGGYVVVWESSSPSASAAVKAQKYSADGQPVGIELTLSDGANPNPQRSPDVVALDNGGFAVTWWGTNAVGSNLDDIHAAVVGADGAVVKSDFVVNTELDTLAPGSQTRSVIFAVPGGFFVAFISDEDTGIDFNEHLLLQKFSNDGTPVGSQVSVAQSTETSFLSLSVGELGDGSFGLVWSGGEPGEENVYMARFNSAGDQLGSNMPVSEAPGDQGRAVVASDGNGKFLIVFEDGSSSPNATDNINGQFIDFSGNPVAPGGSDDPVDSRFAVSDPLSHGGQGGSPAIVALHTGGYFVAWFESWSGSTVVAGQLFDTDGKKVGDEMLIKGVTATPYSADYLQLAELADGRIVVTWSDDSHDGADQDGYGVHAQIIDPRGGLIVGTDNSETLLGSTPGSSGDDTITALDGDDVVLAYDGKDSVLGGNGNDTLDGGENNDTLDGGAGDDIFYVDSAGDLLIEALNGGYDVAFVDADYTLAAGAHVEKLMAQEGNEYSLVGNEFDNWLVGDNMWGWAGNDTLDGGASSVDSMYGGTGDDLFIVDEMNDQVTEYAGEGNDTVRAVISYALSSTEEVENLILTGTGDLDGTGNALHNKLTGNAFDNDLFGLAGNDTLDGGEGGDTMYGGEGDDTYVVDSDNDEVNEDPDQGTDTVRSSIDYVLDPNVENLTLTGTDSLDGTGNALDNKLTGNGNDNDLFGLAGNDTLDGGTGADTMEGGAGNDRYYVDAANDLVIELADGGTDTVRSSMNHVLGANVENLLLTGGAAIGQGNGENNNLRGNSLDNTLKGGAGNDSLDGGLGVDSLDGGSGSDTYVLGTSKDHVKDSSGADDKITTTISRSLGSYTGIENLTLGSIGDINGRGTAVANDLLGNAGKNKLWGLAGDDLLRGGAGADQLWGGKDKDVFDFNSASEIGKSTGNRDIVRDFKHLSDRIDLKSIDASTTASGNNAFAFLAAEGSKFSGVAGQLTWDQVNKPGSSNDVTLVRGDLNGDKVADFVLELSGLVTLTKADFIL